MKLDTSKLLELISDASYHLDWAKQHLQSSMDLDEARDEFQNAISAIKEAMRGLAVKEKPCKT